jgi:hypothetical protein
MTAPTTALELVRASSGASRPVIGVADDGQPVLVDAGHVLALAWPGYGASSLLRLVGAQFAAAGVRVDVIDASGAEHRWCEGLKDVHVVSESAQVHRHLFALAEDLETATTGKNLRHVVLVESEPTTTVLQQYQREPVPGGFALDAVVRILARGQLHGVRVVMACRTVPSALAHLTRDLFGTVLTAVPAPDTRHLAGPHQELFEGELRPGLWQYPQDDRLRLVQTPYLSEREAAELAAGSRAHVREDAR